MKSELKISGMSCVGCARGIEKALNKIPQVSKVNVNFSMEKAYLELVSPEVLGDVKEKIVELGYKVEAEEINEKDNQLSLFFISIVLSLLLFALAMGPLKNTFSQKANWILQMMLAFPVWAIIGLRFQKSLLRFLTTFQSNMNTLIGLGTSAAFLYSSVITLFPSYVESIGLESRVYFEAVGFIVSFVFLGQYFEEKAKKKAKEALNTLLDFNAKEANVFVDGKEVTTSVKDINLGDLIRVRPGEKFVVDGVVVEGTSTVNESMLTGESLPVLKNKQSQVFAGTINGESVLDYRATKVGGNTFLDQMIKLVEEAQEKKAPIQFLADKISSVFVPIVILISLITLFSWGSFGTWGQGISAMIAVLVIACPCALGLATPTAVMIASSRASLKGILIGGGDIIEKAVDIDTIVFDKTGTLTEGKPKVVESWLLSGDTDYLQEIVSIESFSEHPLAQALVQFGEENKVELSEPTSFEIVPGKGVKAILGKADYFIGSRKYMELCKFEVENHLSKGMGTRLYAVRNGVFVGQFLLKDETKSSSKEVVANLKCAGIETHLLSGDTQEIVEQLGKDLEIDFLKSEVLPNEKERYIQNLKQKGKKVAMVGDGVNDAPALSTADLSFAMGTGTDVAKNAADVTLVHGDIHSVWHFFELAKKSFTIIKQNLFLSFIYNLICLPLAAGVFIPIIGFAFPPAFASLAMGLSSLSVVGNSLRIRRFV